MPQNWFATNGFGTTAAPPAGPTPYTGDPNRQPASAEQFMGDDGEDPGWIGGLKKLAMHFYQSSPVALAKMAVDLHPGNPQYFQNAMKVREDLVNASKDQWEAAANSKGWDKVSHTLAAIIPMAGPMARQVGEETGRVVGNVADKANNKGAGYELAGDVIGLGSSALLAPGLEGAKATGRAFAGSKAGGALADTLDAMANRKLVRATVQSGTNKTAVGLGSRMDDMAPDILRDRVSYKDPKTGETKTVPLPKMSAASRTGLAGKFNDALDTARSEMDDTYQKFAEDVVATKPVVDAVKTKLSDMNVKGIKTYTKEEAAKLDPDAVAEFKAAGGKVNKDGSMTGSTETEISTHQIRQSVIKSGLEELSAIGQQMPMSEIYKLAKSWNEGAKAVYTSTTEPGYREARAAGMGYADLERTVRDFITKKYPDTAPVNAKFHLLQSASDIMQGAENIDRVKSRSGVGVKMIGGAVGELAGAAMGHGMIGAATGVVLAPIIDAALTKGTTTAIGTARALAKVADALREGKKANAQAAIAKAAQTAGTTVKPSVLSKLFGDQRGMIDLTGKTGIPAQPGGAEFTPVGAEPPAGRPTFPDPANAAFDRARAAQGMGQPGGMKPASADPTLVGAGMDAVRNMPKLSELAADPEFKASISQPRTMSPEQEVRVNARIDDALTGLLKEDVTPTEERAAKTALSARITGRGERRPSMKQVDFYVGTLDALNSAGHKLSMKDVSQLTSAVDTAFKLGRKSGSRSVGGDIRSGVVFGNDLESFVRDVRRYLPQYSGITKTFTTDAFKSAVKAQMGIEVPTTAAPVKAIDPETMAGRHLTLPDGKEVWKREDGTIVTKDKRGLEAPLGDKEMSLVGRFAPYLLKGSQ